MNALSINFGNPWLSYWKHATEMNKGFSKHVVSKEHLTC